MPCGVFLVWSGLGGGGGGGPSTERCGLDYYTLTISSWCAGGSTSLFSAVWLFLAPHPVGLVGFFVYLRLCPCAHLLESKTN